MSGGETGCGPHDEKMTSSVFFRIARSAEASSLTYCPPRIEAPLIIRGRTKVLVHPCPESLPGLFERSPRKPLPQAPPVRRVIDEIQPLSLHSVRKSRVL